MRQRMAAVLWIGPLAGAPGASAKGAGALALGAIGRASSTVRFRGAQS